MAPDPERVEETRRGVHGRRRHCGEVHLDEPAATVQMSAPDSVWKVIGRSARPISNSTWASASVA